MFRNYLAAALRNITKNRLYAVINIVGLSVGFVAALLIALYVRDELSYDAWFSNSERTHLVYVKYAPPGRTPLLASVMVSDAAKWIEAELPDVEATTRLIGAGGLHLRRDDVEAVEHDTFWADPNVFDVLPLKAIAGDLSSALDAPDGIVLTRSLARKYFGTDAPIGETIQVNREHVMQVRAVIEDLPSNTHLSFKAFGSGLASFSRIAEDDAVPYNGGRGKSEDAFTYVRLGAGAALAPLQQELNTLFDRHPPVGIASSPIEITYTLVPLRDIHFHEPTLSDRKVPNSMGVIWAMVGVGSLILFAAGVNFVNLMTARSMRGAMEVGVRKALGAKRRDLIVQFIGGALMYVIFAMAVAGVAAASLLPLFNGFLARAIAIDFWRSPELVFSGLVVAGVFGVLAGLYPALVLSRHRPAFAIRSAIASDPRAHLIRQVLVVLQFAILIGLVVATTVIYRQTQFAIGERLRFANAQAVMLTSECTPSLVNELRKIDGVLKTACSSAFAVQRGRLGTSAVIEGGPGTRINLRVSPADSDFFDFFGVEVLAGKVYTPSAFVADNPGQATQGPAVVINRTALGVFGFSTPGDAVGRSINWQRFFNMKGEQSPRIDSPIVGVVEDFSLGSVRDAIEPALYYFEPQFSQVVNVMVRGDAVPEVAAAIGDVWKRVGPGEPMELTFLDRLIQELYADMERQSYMFTVFAAVAVFIACLGLLGLSAFTAEQRTKEIGIRKSMGATRRDILRLILWQFAKPVLWANLIAWPVAYFVMRRWLEGFAYHIDLSPWMFLAASAAALLIAVATVIGHALLVARAQPVTALRYE